MSQELKNRTKKFALDVIGLCAGLPHIPETRHAIDPLIRSSISVAANYRSARLGKLTTLRLIGSENCSAATSANSCRAHQQIGYSSDHSPRSLHCVAECSADRRQGWRDMRELSQQSLEERFTHAHTAEGNRHTGNCVHQGHDR